tara:strand:+ start:2581 stop:3957 length:1377 start_codon:yes stop_codon:yes gene_type:complete
MARGQTHGKTSGFKVATTQSYVRDFVKLFPNSAGDEFTDIKQLINRIIFKENIRQGSIICEIDVLDGLNMLETFKLSGGEKVEIQLSQNTPLGNNKLRKTFFVSDIINHTKPRPGYQTYQLICISEYAYLNNLIRLDRDFSGSPGSLIKNILKKDLRVKDEDIFKCNTESGSIIQGIYPKLKPLDAINWLKRNAFDENTPFYFYDTLHKGLILNSLKELINEDSDIEYIHKPYFGLFKNEEEEFVDSRKRVRKLSSNLGMSKFNQAGKGSYSSSLTSIDIATKTVVENFDYRYNDDFAIKEHKLEGKTRAGNKPFSSETKFLDRELNNFPQSRRFNLSLNSLAFDKKNYHDHVPLFIQKSEAIKNGFDYMSLELILNGDFRLHCGKMVSIIIPKATSKGLTKSNKEIDEVLSGSYIVTNIIHEFNMDEYVMNAELKKDSTLISLEGSINFKLGVTDEI